MTEEVKKTELYVGDISQYNTIQQYTLLKEHFDGVVVRVGYRGYSAGTIKEDALFAKHMQGLIENRIPYGFYFMGQAVTEQEAISEAEYCHEMTKSYSPALPVYYDSELSNPKGDGRADHLSRRMRTDITKAFCEKILQLGMRAGVYASKSWLETNLYAEELAEYSIWVARYNASLGYHEIDYDMWQYTSDYSIPGLNTRLDRSYCYRAFDQDGISNAKPEEEPVLEVREGVYGYSLEESGQKRLVLHGMKTKFLLREFRCRDGSDEVLLDSGLLEILQRVRDHFGKAVSITSAYRTDEYNKGVNEAESSYHLKGQAADFTVTGTSNRDVAKFLQGIGVKGIGLYDYTGGFIHVDTREKSYYWQQDRRDGKCYGVSSFGKTEVYLVKGQTVTTVRYNDRNEYVRLLQGELGVETDGIFGAETEAAVRQFQRTHGLTVDGVAGIKTWDALL